MFSRHCNVVMVVMVASLALKLIPRRLRPGGLHEECKKNVGKTAECETDGLLLSCTLPPATLPRSESILKARDSCSLPANS